ncbi:MAG: hypothetical protein ACYDAN_06315, partial [Candidatus Limnocylindrales bacterium]
MDHAEVVERIELAAVEPEGLARLAAGDTAEAAAVAGHLAGCDACTSELARTARVSTLARQAIRELPDPGLRDRTLRYVRDVGRDCAAEADAPAAPVGVPRPAPSSAAASSAGSVPTEVGESPAAALPSLDRPRSRRAWWAAASVAAVLVAAVGGFLVGGGAR